MYEPDLVLVSFGWNDPATTPEMPDKDYTLPSPGRVRLVRTLLRYHFYRAAHSLLSARLAASASTLTPRVSPEDYRDNLRGFSLDAGMRGIPIVFLTRPHRESRRQLTQMRNNWRSQVPLYNHELRRFAQRSGMPMIDVRKAFSNRQDAFIDECRFTLAGHRQMAQLVFTNLAGLRLLPEGVQDPIS